MKVAYEDVRSGMTVWWVGCALFDQSKRFVESLEVEEPGYERHIPEAFRDGLYTTREEAEEQL